MKRDESIEKYEKAIIGSGGIINTILKRLGVKHYERVKAKIFNNKKLKALYLAEVEKIADIAENNIIKQIREGDVGVSRWYLQMKAKDRGYVEQQKINVSMDFSQKTVNELENIFKNG